MNINIPDWLRICNQLPPTQRLGAQLVMGPDGEYLGFMAGKRMNGIDGDVDSIFGGEVADNVGGDHDFALPKLSRKRLNGLIQQVGDYIQILSRSPFAPGPDCDAASNQVLDLSGLKGIHNLPSKLGKRYITFHRQPANRLLDCADSRLQAPASSLAARSGPDR